MTAALQLTPEELRAMVRAEVVAALAVVPRQAASPRDESSLSTLPHSKRRRACERRKAALRRSQEIGSCDRPLSTKPESVRRRKSEQKAAAAHPIGSIDPVSLDLQPVITERTNTRRSPSDRSETGGPLAGAIAAVVDRASDYAESTRKRELAWLYEEATRIFREDLGLQLPERWSGPKDWGAAKVLVREWKRDELLEAIRSTCSTWRPSAKWSRPTLGLVLKQLRGGRPAAAPGPDSRRLTGTEIEERDRAKARAAATPVAPMRPAAATSPLPKKPAIWIGEKPRPGDEVRPAKEQIALILEQLEQRRGAP